MKEGRHILIVDDEERNRLILTGMIESFGYKPVVARSGFEALSHWSSHIDLVLLDAIMPGIDGFEVLRRLRADAENGDVPIVMITGLTAKEDRLRAIEAGVNDFLAKPVDMVELRVRIASLLKMKEMQDALKRHRRELEQQVEERTAALRQALEQITEEQHRTYEASLDTIHRLAVAAEYKDKETAAHIYRMSHYAALLARALRLPPSEVEQLLYASRVHDIGKIGIPDAILLKPGALTTEEWEIMKQHTTIGARILNGSSLKVLQMGEVIALSHHEKWDGSGYPYGLAGEEIPLWGRICAVADVFDALTSNRPYKKAFANEKASEILRDGRGSHFDPQIIDLFFEHFDEVLVIQAQYSQEAETSALARV